MNGHLMGFFPSPITGSPQKGTLKRPRPPRRGLFSLIHVAREKVLGAAGPMLRRDIRYRGLAGAVVEFRKLHCACRPSHRYLLDFGMGLLLISVSGFILQGVNNTGPMMPEAVFLR